MKYDPKLHKNIPIRDLPDDAFDTNKDYCDRCGNHGTVKAPKYPHIAKLKSQKRFGAGEIIVPCPKCQPGTDTYVVFYTTRKSLRGHMEGVIVKASSVLGAEEVAKDGLARADIKTTKSLVAHHVDSSDLGWLKRDLKKGKYTKLEDLD